MADEGNIISNLNLDGDAAGGPVPNGEDTMPAIGLISQYVKDLSVENPNAPESYQWTEAPEIGVDFNISARTIQPEIHEIELKVNVTAKTSQGSLYLVELVYCGLIGIRNVPEEQAHAFLFAEAPRLLFPFARAVVADAVRDAGFQPLMIDPIDFVGLYRQQRQRGEAAAQQTPA